MSGLSVPAWTRTSSGRMLIGFHLPPNGTNLSGEGLRPAADDNLPRRSAAALDRHLARAPGEHYLWARVDWNGFTNAALLRNGR